MVKSKKFVVEVEYRFVKAAVMLLFIGVFAWSSYAIIKYNSGMIESRIAEAVDNASMQTANEIINVFIQKGMQCEPVPVTVGNITLSFVPVECLQQ